MRFFDRIAAVTKVSSVVALVVGLAACTQNEKLPELYLLQGPCEIAIKTDQPHSEIFVDGILIGHGQARSKVPCGEKRVQVEAPEMKLVEDYQYTTGRAPLELSYQMQKIKHVEDWAMSGELVDQLAKGEGTYDRRNPKYKEIAANQARIRDEEGYFYTAAEMAAAAKKVLGSDEADSGAAGPVKIDPNTNFDDPKTWL